MKSFTDKTILFFLSKILSSAMRKCFVKRMYFTNEFKRGKLNSSKLKNSGTCKVRTKQASPFTKIIKPTIIAYQCFQSLPFQFPNVDRRWMFFFFAEGMSVDVASTEFQLELDENKSK
jgi:hypothetical protein